MKKISLVIVCCFAGLCSFAQNVGIGTTTPGEKLDVNGNVNVGGQLKLAGSAGTAGQILQKDASNNPVWTDLSEYKNMIVFDCPNYSITEGIHNCTESWIVPAGVTSIVVECWGGGGGGGAITAGGGGGYVMAKLTVTPGANTSLTIGAGGRFASAGIDAIRGGNTSFVLGGTTLGAFGGLGGSFVDPFFSSNSGQSSGGDFLVTGISNQYIGFKGSPGGISKLSFVQVSATEFAKVVNYGDGGDAALIQGSGGKGGYKLLGSSISQSMFATISAIHPGGGGGADDSHGYYGKGGRIIIRW
jgi:hypothetical protein